MTRQIVVLALFSSALISAQEANPITAPERARIEAIHAGADLRSFYLPSVMLDGKPTDASETIAQSSADSNYAVEGTPFFETRRDAAVVIGTERAGTNQDAFRFVRLWVNNAGQWRIGASHRTMVAQPLERAASSRLNRKPAYASASGVEGEVLDAHRLLNDAWSRHDIPLYSRHTASSFVTVDTAGLVRSREEFLRGVGGDQPRVIAFSDNTTVRVFGDIAVVGFRHLDVRPDGTPNGGPQWRTRVFVRNTGVWQQVIAQAIRAE